MDPQPLPPDPPGSEVTEPRPSTPTPSTSTSTPSTSSSGPSGNFTPQKKSLGLLAEIACLTAAAEQKDDELMAQRSTVDEETKPKIISYTVEEVRHWPVAQLLATFTECSRDPKRKLFTFKCHMLPAGQCEARFDGPEEEKTRAAMAEHLAGHLCNVGVAAQSQLPPPPSEASSSTTNTMSSPQITFVPTRSPSPPKEMVAEPMPIPPPPSSSSSTLPSSEMKDEPMLDHVYTLPAVQVEAPTVVAVKSPVIVDVPMVEDRLEVIEMANTTTVGSPLAPTIVSETVEVTSDPSPPPAPTVKASAVKSQQGSTTTTTTSSSPPDVQMQSLALHYIEDIRRKSSTAAKSVIINGDRSLIYQCKICPDKQFTSTNGLIFHYKKHAGLKPYVCELCSSTFTRQHSLNYHMLIHMNKSRFVCSECSRHFRHPSHFKEHMRRHTGETPFQCADCLIRFKTRNTYKRHLQTKHSKILTSKGIIELSPAAVPYQSVPRHPSGTTTVTTAGSMPAVATGSVASSVKPRRKYAISYLHKNIETISKYEEQQQAQQHLVAVAGTSGQEATLMQLGATAQTAPGSNITILSIPQLPTTLHILNNPPSGPETANLARQALAEFNSQQQPITLVLPAGTITTTEAKVLEPITLEEQPLALTAAPPSHTHYHHLTELTSMAPVTLTTATSASPAAMVSQTALPQPQQPSTVVAPQPSQQQQPSNNDNFQRLLEAIALTEA